MSSTLHAAFIHCLGRVGGDCVENVDEHKEEGDKEGHAPGDHVHRNQERDPGYYHKQSCGTIFKINYDNIELYNTFNKPRLAIDS